MAKKAKAKSKSKEKKDGNFIDHVIDALNSQYPGSVISMAKETKFNVETIGTGASNLDRATGVSGIPMGKMTELYGIASCGKTTTCLHIVSEFQKKQKQKEKENPRAVLYVDAEHGLDINYAKALGVNVQDLILTQSSCAEDILNIVQRLIKTNEIGLVIIDSVPALVPKSELEGTLGELPVGLQARLNSQFCRVITPLLWDAKTALILINQTRDKIGYGYGGVETPGGKAIKFYSTMRIELRRLGNIKQGDKIIGSKVKAIIVKNKLAAPYQTAEFNIYFGSGISKEMILLNQALDVGIIKKSIGWFKWEDGTVIGHGEETIKEMIKTGTLGEELKNKLDEKGV